MDEKKFILLLQSEDFLAKLNDAETIADAKKIFEYEGISLSDDKIKTVMEALDAANKKARDGEVMTEKDLDSVSGGGIIKKLLEFIILSALIWEGNKIYQGVKKNGGLQNKHALDAYNAAARGWDATKKASERFTGAVVNWLSTP